MAKVSHSLYTYIDTAKTDIRALVINFPRIQMPLSLSTRFIQSDNFCFKGIFMHICVESHRYRRSRRHLVKRFFFNIKGFNYTFRFNIIINSFFYKKKKLKFVFLKYFRFAKYFIYIIIFFLPYMQLVCSTYNTEKKPRIPY